MIERDLDRKRKKNQDESRTEQNQMKIDRERYIEKKRIKDIQRKGEFERKRNRDVKKKE